MIEMLSCTDIEVLTYFGYTSIVQDEICEFRETEEVRRDRNNPNMYLRGLFERVVKIAEDEYHRQSLRDNKCVFLIKYENREFFIGYYDHYYTLGLACCLVCGNVLDFQDGIHYTTCASNVTFNNSADVKGFIAEYESQLKLIEEGA